MPTTKRKKSTAKNTKPKKRQNPFITKVISHSLIESTQADALALAHQGEPQGCVVWADAQSEGRGRHAHDWESPAGVNLYLSIIFRPNFGMERVHEIQFLAGVSMAQAIEKVCRKKIYLKWPNDIMFKGKKLGGILLNSGSEGDGKASFVVMGVGLNVNADPKAFSPDVRLVATSLFKICKKPVDRGRVFQEFLKALDKNHTRHERLGFAPLQQAWRQWAKPFLSQPIHIREAILENGETLSSVLGKPVGLSNEGYLLLRTKNSGLITVVDGLVGQRRKTL